MNDSTSRNPRPYSRPGDVVTLAGSLTAASLGSVATLGATEANVEPAMRFLDSRNVHYYWDPNGAIMARYATTLGVKVAIWGFWTIYRPGTRWTISSPPMPDVWRHQLSALPPAKRLDVTEFIERIKAIEEHSSQPSTPSSP